jgi:catechol 2,3-dioxygenase-like lactoylglutathione lyase family enzyme
MTTTDGPGGLHHLELWVGDLPTAELSWGWLLTRLGYTVRDRWPAGVSWGRATGPYVVLEAGPHVASAPHDRLRPGLNHVAFRAGTRAELDALVAVAPEHGWSLLFADRHPFAGGPDHYAAYLENADGFEVELVASDGAAASTP